jgi:leucyl aminopeptidase (aminopeptidase T)
MLDLRLQGFNRPNNRIFQNVFLNSLKINKFRPKKILVVGDNSLNNNSAILSSAYYNAVNNLGFDAELHMQGQKLSVDSIDGILSRKLKMLPDKSLIIINASDKLGKFDYHHLSFRKFCKSHNHKWISSSGLKNLDPKNLRYFINALDVDFEDQHSFGQKLKNALDSASEVRITTDAGTDLIMSVKGRKAINNSGIYNEWGSGGNMPAGEVYIPPVEGTVSGRLVIDGSIRTWKKTIIPTEPVKIDIEDGEVTKIYHSPMAKLLRDTFAWAARRSKISPRNVKKVAELGIGTNREAKIIGTTIVDEKKYGSAHIAFGSNSWFGGNIKAITHFDQVFRNPIIKIDGKLFRF